MNDINFKKLNNWIEESQEAMPPETLLRQREAFLTNLASGRKKVLFVSAIAAAALALLGVGLWGVLGTSGHSSAVNVPENSLPVAEAPVADSHRIERDAQGHESIVFGGGSRFSLDAGAVARVVESGSRLVVVELFAGKISCDIHGNGRTRWQVKAGDYQVLVTGTEFTVDWNSKTEFFEVRVSEGSVKVSGGTLNRHGILLAAGENLSVDSGKFVLSTKGQPVAASNTAAAPTREGHSQGEFDSTDTENKGETATVTRGHRPLPTALWQEAQRARYSGDFGMAYRKLQLLVKRHFGSKHHGQALFLLGRIALESKHDPGLARRWFERYLNANPGGPLVEESLGRLIRVCQQQNAPCAQRYSKRYLAQYPRGIFAKLAQSVVR